MFSRIKSLGLFVVFCLLMTTSVRAEGSVWNPLGEGTGEAALFTMESFEGELVVGGWPSSLTKPYLGVISRWDGSAWQVMGDSLGHVIQDMVEYNGQLIAVAEPIIYAETSRDTLTTALVWDGSSWIDLGFGPWGDFNAAIVWNGKLVVAGNFDTAAGAPIKGVATWDGSNWEGLGYGLDGRVRALVEFEGDLIAAGSYLVRGDGLSLNNIARWDGVSWQPMGDGFTHEVSVLTVYSNQLLAAGRVWESGTEFVGRVAVWDGSSWSSFAGGTDLFNVTSLAEYHGELLATDGNNRIRRFDGTSWNPVAGLWGTVRALQVFDDRLVIAGSSFRSFDGLDLHNVAWRTSFDQDSDGLYDVEDNCIWTANPGQENADGDLAGDACDDCYGCESSVYLHHVEGLKGSDTVYAGTPVRFYFAVSGFPGDGIGAINATFKLSSPDGATWAIPEMDTVMLGIFDQYAIVDFRSTDLTGSGSDTISFSALKLSEDVLPIDFHEVLFYIETAFTSDGHGKTFCIDSVSGTVVGDWVMSRSWKESLLPFWDGPHTFTIVACCQGSTGDIASDNGEVDITDVGVLVDHLFLTLNPLVCEASGNINYPGSGYPTTDNIVDIYDLQLLIDNQFLTLSPLSPCP